MASKSNSAVQRVTQTLRGYLKNDTGKALLDKSLAVSGLNLSKQINNRAWPDREENFAAVQLLRQTRNWNNFRKFGNSETESHLSNKGKYTSRRHFMSQRYDDRSSDKYDENYKSRNVNADKNDERPRIGTGHDMIFGNQEKDDYLSNQLRTDNELLSLVAKHRLASTENSVSRKVIAPYSTYKTHRNNWAEFRHRMIYGDTQTFPKYEK